MVACGGGGGSSGGGGGSSEKAPLVVAAVIAPAIGVVGSGRVDVAVTATKQDNSNTTAVTFPPTVAASGCTATLAGSGTSGQYSGATINSSVMVTYTVNSSVAVECGAFTFSATEDGAVGRGTIVAGTIRFDMDSDRDGFADAVDVDADGDGLIEINTAAELNMMRHNLAGTGLDADNSDNDNTTGGNSDGCGGGMTASGTAITTCNGYEQMANLDLNDLAAVYPSPATWERVGFCTGLNSAADCPANAFTGKFNGNNHNISNMHIHITTNSFGVGLFGAVSSGSAISNMHVRGGSITHQAGAELRFTGGLAGAVLGGVVNASSVTLSEINASDRITGGLIGIARDTKIISSAAVVGTLIGRQNIGGMVGELSVNTLISSSAVIVGKIINPSLYSGGLVGVLNSNPQEISASYAVVGLIMSDTGVGGLIGVSSLSTNYVISHSYAMSLNLTSSDEHVGGLAGGGANAIINSSYAVSHSIAGTGQLGGLAGGESLFFEAPNAAIDSYWDTTTLMPPDNEMRNVSHYGEGQPTSALQIPTTFTGIYANWGDGYCNPDTGEFRTGNPSAGSGFVRAWNLDGSDEYPKLNCQPNYDPAQLQQAIDRVLAGESPIQ